MSEVSLRKMRRRRNVSKVGSHQRTEETQIQKLLQEKG